MNIFIDTNLWLRFFIRDNEKHYALVENMLQSNEESKLKLATSTFVLSEVVYTQQSFYKVPKKHVIEDILAISSIKNLFLIEQTNLSKTIELFTEHKNAKWSDCIISGQVPANYKLCSFDIKLQKIIGKKSFITPQDVVKNL